MPSVSRCTRPPLALAICFCAIYSPFLAGQRSAAGPSAAEATRLFQAGSNAFAAGDLKTAHADFFRLAKIAPEVSAAHSAFGAVLLAEGDLRAAVAELTTARRIDPHDIQATINLAVAESRLGNAGSAVTHFREVPQGALSALQAPETVAYAVALAGTGDRTGAEAVLQGALANGQPTPELLDTLGSLHAQANKMDAARDEFTRAVSLSDTYAPAHAHLGSLLLVTGDLNGSVAELRRAVALGDKSVVTKVQLGRALSASGEDAAAVELLETALAAQPTSVEAQYALALALEAAGRSQEALPLFAKVALARPGSADVLINQALALVQTGDAKAAIVLYRKAEVLDPNRVTLHENMGVAYLQTNDLDDAIKEFQAGLVLDANSPQLHYDLGLAWKLKDNLPEAVKELERAQTLDPKLPDPPYTLGVLRMQQGDAAAAARELQQAVTLKPGNGEAWALLGSVRRDTGDFPGATDALRRAVALEPDQPSPHVTLAAVLTASGDREGAAAERKVAADLSRKAMTHQRAGFALQSGRALLAKGDVPGAVLQLTDAVAADPNLKEAHLLLAEALDRQGRPADALAERQKAEALPASH